MKDLTARNIQMFVAGAFAIDGFQTAYWLPYDFIHATSSYFDLAPLLLRLVSALTLLLGVGILFGSTLALKITRIYLWMEVILEIIGLVFLLMFAPNRAFLHIWWLAPEIVASILLLGLLMWSRSQRFQTPPTPASETSGSQENK